jgi:hypothetical protein
MAGSRLEVSRSPGCRTQDHCSRPCLCRQKTLMVCISGQHDQSGSAFGHPAEQVLHTVVHFANCWQFMCVGHLGKRNKRGLPVTVGAGQLFYYFGMAVGIGIVSALSQRPSFSCCVTERSRRRRWSTLRPGQGLRPRTSRHGERRWCTVQTESKNPT